MARRLALFLATLVASLAAVSTASFAQSPLCDRYRAELASLPQGGDPRTAQFEAQARRLREELARTKAYYQQLGCGRGFLFFEAQNPPQCAGVQARVQQLQAQYSQAAQGAQQAGGGTEQRRRQLLAAIDQNCRAGAVEARRPNFFEQLFGIRPREEAQDPQQAGIPPDGQGLEAPHEDRPRSYGGSRVVCVRTCDGYFFPLPTGGREGAQDLCQALCPATETLVYFMAPDGRIENAGNREGKPYTELANAGRYKRSVDPACGCRKPGESWAQALQHAEELLGNRRNDIIVTAEKAEELSRPKIDKIDPRKPNPKDAKPAAKPPAQPSAAAATDAQDTPEGESPAEQASVPTANGESSGIGPQTIVTEQTVSQREGQFREVIGADGKKQQVRVVAPNIFAAPQSQPQSR